MANSSPSNSFNYAEYSEKRLNSYYSANELKKNLINKSFGNDSQFNYKFISIIYYIRYIFIYIISIC